jgi:hypothetical protein
MSTETEIKFLSFPSIEGFHNVVRAVDAYPHITGESKQVTYRGKIKLHGTNAGVRLDRGIVRAQSRTQLISADNDNAGFAAWVESRRDFFQALTNSRIHENFTLFGEWCGPGIMKGTAINQIPKKIFAVFALMYLPEVPGESHDALMFTEPLAISQFLATAGSVPDDIHVLPWHDEPFDVNFHDRDSLQSVVNKLNKVVDDVEPCDPWVKQTFGVDGTAEGVVYYPGAGIAVSRKYYSDLSFKAKGEKHKVVKTKAAVQIDPEVAKNIGDFVSMFVTEARLEQGLATVGAADMKNIPAFLKWFGQDVHKESADELAASSLEWSQVDKAVQTAARNWFIAKAKAI